MLIGGLSTYIVSKLNLDGEKKVDQDSVENFVATVYSHDQLQEMNDDRLDALRGMLRGKIFSLQKNNSKQNSKQILHLQTEYAYVSRELEIRVKRKKMHEEYVQKIRATRASRSSRPGRPRRRHNA